jgi:hypothetical protein
MPTGDLYDRVTHAYAENNGVKIHHKSCEIPDRF